MSKPAGTKCYTAVSLETLKSLSGNLVIPVSRVWLEKYNAAAALLGATPISGEASLEPLTKEALVPQEPPKSGLGNVMIG